MTDQHTSPCGECPFNRKVAPGELGGSPPEMYVGQAAGPFFLPCHSTHDYTDAKARQDLNNSQCAGAAIFRANVGVARQLPPALLHLPKDTKKVFATFEEFYAHHKQIPLTEAARLLKEKGPDKHLLDEFQKREARVRLLERRP